MTVQSDSRYESSPVVNLYGPTGLARQVIVGTPQQSYNFSYVSYMVTGQDRIDNLADSFYGDSSMWWKFADANPEILDWSNLEAGTIIRVPNVS